MEDNILETKLLIGLNLRKIEPSDILDICNWDFNYEITKDENYLYFTVMESFKVFTDLVIKLGVNYSKYLNVLIFNNKSEFLKTSSVFYPVYYYIDNKLTFTLSDIYRVKDCYIQNDGYLSAGELAWLDADDIDVDGNNPKLICRADFLLEMCHAGIITDEKIIKEIKLINEFPF